MNERDNKTWSSQQILSMLPHQFPFRFISNIIQYIPQRVLKTEFTPSSMLPFVRFEYVPETVLIEGIAQTAVLLTQLETKPLVDGEVPLLGSVKMEAFNQALWGKTILFEVEPVRTVGQKAVLKGKALVESGTLIIATVSVAVTSNQK